MNHYAGPPLAHLVLAAPSSHTTANLYRVRDLLPGPLTDREEQLCEALAEALDELSAARERADEAEDKAGEQEGLADARAEEAAEASARAERAESRCAVLEAENPEKVKAFADDMAELQAARAERAKLQAKIDRLQPQADRLGEEIEGRETAEGYIARQALRLDAAETSLEAYKDEVDRLKKELVKALMADHSPPKRPRQKKPTT